MGNFEDFFFIINMGLQIQKSGLSAQIHCSQLFSFVIFFSSMQQVIDDALFVFDPLC